MLSFCENKLNLLKLDDLVRDIVYLLLASTRESIYFKFATLLTLEFLYFWKRLLAEILFLQST